MKNKNIIITGTSRGIGLELAMKFANEGHQVLAISRKISTTLIENPNITCLSIDVSISEELLQVEKLLLSNNNFQTTILRFGGLIGEDRHPIKFLAGKTNVENPDAPINLIHQEDCIGIIVEMLNRVQHDREIGNVVFNAVTPQHPARKEYYTQKAIENNLSLPIFDDSKKSVGKLISSKKVEEVLAYKFTAEI